MADIETHARRKAAGETSVLSPIAIEVVRQIDALFEIERAINGQSPQQRRAVRQEKSAPLTAALKLYLEAQYPKLPRRHDLAKAMNYMLKCWASAARQSG
jgi:hypothetical protein